MGLKSVRNCVMEPEGKNVRFTPLLKTGAASNPYVGGVVPRKTIAEAILYLINNPAKSRTILGLTLKEDPPYGDADDAELVVDVDDDDDDDDDDDKDDYEPMESIDTTRTDANNQRGIWGEPSKLPAGRPGDTRTNMPHGSMDLARDADAEREQPTHDPAALAWAASAARKEKEAAARAGR